MSTTEDFTIGRNNPIENVGPAELNALLGQVAAEFGPDWLALPSGTNRIQTLWSRQDGLATNQLAILGDAIKRLTPLNADWVACRIQAIKSESAENRKGDLFELLGLSLFALDGQSVTGAGEGNPGYDGTIDFGRGALASVSLKDFGVSSHQRVFETRAASIEHAMIADLRDLRLNGLGLRIDASRHPLQADWERLRRAVARIISDCRSDWRPRQAGSIWTLTPQSLPVGHVQLADGHLSYALATLAPHHANEQRNIEAKIEDACANLSKHAGTLAASTARFLLIRIPEAASSTECVACTQQWLQDRPDAQVDAVILYQPVVAAPSISAPAGIVHFIAIVTGPGFERWRHTIGRPGLAIQARVLVGSCTNQPTKLFGTDGSALGEQYIYQRGQIYALSQTKPDGAIVGNTANPAPGIVIHSVMRFPGQPGEMVLTGKFPPDAKMLLYS
jgi:hypothetical protein